MLRVDPKRKPHSYRLVELVLTARVAVRNEGRPEANPVQLPSGWLDENITYKVTRLIRDIPYAATMPIGAATCSASLPVHLVKWKFQWSLSQCSCLE
ncbi:MAG: hypothetical protein QF530_13790, partial [SAR202 cluster bacterium]|nr:hypothetical protein [SAR202 cluster bacterium]